MVDEKLNLVKEIVSKYTQIPVSGIDYNTHLGKSAFKGSIIIHRMYAELEKNNIVVPKYHLIESFGGLVKAISGDTSGVEAKTAKKVDSVIQTSMSKNSRGGQINIQGIGIDIEHIENLPDADDFRTDSFYSATFSAQEIAHCIASNDPKMSFAGIFAVKEAIFKCSNFEDLSAITIQFDVKGKPTFEGYLISISHSNGFAVANALRL